MIRFLVPALLCAALAGCETAPQVVDMNKPAPACFQVTDFRTWKAADAKTLYVRAGLSNYYRLDMVGSCPALTHINSFLVTTFRGTSSICSNLDWDLKVSEVGGFPIPCIVEKQTPLTPTQAAQIPPQFKP